MLTLPASGKINLASLLCTRVETQIVTHIAELLHGPVRCGSGGSARAKVRRPPSTCNITMQLSPLVKRGHYKAAGRDRVLAKNGGRLLKIKVKRRPPGPDKMRKNARTKLAKENSLINPAESADYLAFMKRHEEIRAETLALRARLEAGRMCEKNRSVLGMIGFAFIYRAALYVSYPARDADFARYITFEDIVACRIANKCKNRPKLTHLRRYFGGLHDYEIHRSIERVKAIGFDGFYSTEMELSNGTRREPMVSDLITLMDEMVERRQLTELDRDAAKCLLSSIVDLGQICLKVKESVGDTLLTTCATILLQ